MDKLVPSFFSAFVYPHQKKTNTNLKQLIKLAKRLKSLKVSKSSKYSKNGTKSSKDPIDILKIFIKTSKNLSVFLKFK